VDTANETADAPHWLLGLSPREVAEDMSQWGSREVDGYFVWVGPDPASDPASDPLIAIETVPHYELERLNDDMRWYLAEGYRLREAVRAIGEAGRRT
jgi:hypothetical protein